MLAAASVALGVCLAGMALLRLTTAAPQRCPELSPAGLEAAAAGAAGWIEAAQHPDGSYVYEYDAEADAIPDDYNAVRHAGVTMSLYQAVALGDIDLLPAADRGMAWMEANLIRHGDWAALRTPRTGRVKLGASSLMLAGLTQRRLATGETERDGLMRELARFLVVMQRADGAMLNYWLESTGAPDPSVTSRYATGEAFWALAQMHRHFPEDGWDEPALLIADYLALERDEAEGIDFPPWADQWAAYGLAEMADWPLAEHHAAYARSLAERFGFLVRVESQRTGGELNARLHGVRSRAAGLGTWVEGLTSLWRLARADERLADLEPKIAERAICGAALLADRQTTDAGAGGAARAELVRGAWFRDGVTRMDDQQHALSGLALTRAILASRGAAP